MTQNGQGFWAELCGSSLARSLGINEPGREALDKFDAYYLDFYPYLQPFLDLAPLPGLSVLEVGLGFGTVSELLATAGAEVTLLDLEENATSLSQFRLQSRGLDGSVITSNFLSNDLPSQSFDRIVAIGSLHHMGSLESALRETMRLLKPTGEAFLMVYNVYSARRWRKSPLSNLRVLFRELMGFRGSVTDSGAVRALYDANSSGEAAPMTEWVSKRSLKEMLRRAGGDVSISYLRAHNWDMNGSSFFARDRVIGGPIEAVLGLDLYVRVRRGRAGQI